LLFDIPLPLSSVRNHTRTCAEIGEQVSGHDLAHQWATSLQPRFTGLVPVRDNNIRNLQTVLFCESANKDIRLQAKHQLERNALDGNDEASAVLSGTNSAHRSKERAA